MKPTKFCETSKKKPNTIRSENDDMVVLILDDLAEEEVDLTLGE
jgi:hypothetical protein